MEIAFRDELFNANVFLSLHDAGRGSTRRIDYNEHRPDGSLGDLTPREFTEHAIHIGLPSRCIAPAMHSSPCAKLNPFQMRTRHAPPLSTDFLSSN